MFGDVWTWAGRLRGHDTNIGVPVQHIESMLFEMLKDLKYWKASPWPLQAAMLHHRAVYIHPFPNGKGRWARMLANIWLRLNKQGHCVWPEETVGATSVIRQEYLQALRAADQGDYNPLRELHQRFMPETSR